MEEGTSEQMTEASKDICNGGGNFVWQDYLDLTSSEQVPPDLFQHVEDSLHNELHNGMMLEVPHKDDPSKYWLATVVLACGPFSRMRYFGYGDDQSRIRDFWGDLTSINAHPLHWSAKEGKQLVPPEDVPAEMVTAEKIEQVLKNAVTVPPHLLTGDGFTPADRIKSDMKVEIQDCSNPYHLWVASIVENVGGRLLLRYDVPGPESSKEFWLFYTSPRIYPMGWAARKGEPWELNPPSDIDSDRSREEWEAVLEVAKDEANKTPSPEGLFEHNKEGLTRHKFEVGMKVESLHPETMSEIYPATVTKVWSDQFFLVELDGSKHTWLCTNNHPYIFPVGWAEKNQLQVQSPAGWKSEDIEKQEDDKQEFVWAEYLHCSDSQAAPSYCFPTREKATERGFKLNMKLEAVNPGNKSELCVSTIVRITGHLLWLQLESNDSSHPNHAVSTDSDLLFPAGWCDSNAYRLCPPQCYQQPEASRASSNELNHNDGSQEKGPESASQQQGQHSLWCPKIYFNHKCFSGPFLSKGKLAGLPQAVGPGPVRLVMREVLSMLISVAYKSSRVLKELQCDGQLKPGEHLEVLKAKYNQTNYRARVAVVTSADGVPEFCHEVCGRLQLCPYLFGPLKVDESGCPGKCNTQSKTKFTQYWLNRKRKPTRPGPAPDHCALEIVGPRKKRGRKKRLGARTSTRSSGSRSLLAEQEGDSDGSGDSGQEDSSQRSRSEIQTRGTKSAAISRQWNSSASEASSTGGTVPRRLPDRGSLKRPRNESNNSPPSNKVAANAVGAWLQPLPKLDSNPLYWTVDDVAQYVSNDKECRQLAKILRDEEIDGQAFLMMNYPTALYQLKLRSEMAIHLCRQVAKVKVAFFQRFVYNM